MAKQLTQAKAKKILHDKSVHGNPLTEKQRKFFGAIAGGAKPYKAEEGGWLDKYEQGGLMLKQKKNDNYGVQGNYNDYNISLPKGFKGWAYNTKGRNYSPAWGGQFQDGGNLMPAMAGANQTVPMAQNGLTFLEPTSKKLPKGFVIPFNTPSTELAMSIGGEQGEPAYLIPSFKYGKPLKDPVAEFRKTGEHLGGPFKTYQEADEWERTVRHPYVEKGQSIPTPLKRWGKDFAMGGSLPGATGMMYARTQNPAPSNGPYAKKTKASAQNGQEMKYYQEGLDFKPKTISQDGAVIDPEGYWNPENWGNPVIIPSTDITMEGVLEPLIGISDTGDVQYMEPGEDYTFDGEYVTEYPVMQKGGRVPIYVDNPNDPRLKAYNDSLRLYKAMVMQDKLMGPGSSPSSYKHDWTTRALKEGRTDKIQKGLEELGPMSKDFKSEKEQFAEGYSALTARKEDKKLINYYRSLGFTDKDIMFHSSPDIVSDKIKAVGTYWDGTAFSPVYKKPVQPVEYRKPEPEPEPQKVKDLPVATLKPGKKPKPVPTDYFQGPSVFAPTPYGGGAAFVGYKTPQGDTVFVKPEDYERMGVPEYGKKFIESKKKQRNGGVNNADAQPIKKLDQLLNFTNYNKPTKGGWLDKYN